jgi:hypothetical protein
VHNFRSREPGTRRSVSTPRISAQLPLTGTEDPQVSELYQSPLEKCEPTRVTILAIRRVSGSFGALTMLSFLARTDIPTVSCA